MPSVVSARCSILSPADHWGLLGSQTALYIQDAAKGAYRNGSLGTIGGLDTYMSQNVPTHTVGVATGTPLAAAVETFDRMLTANLRTAYVAVRAAIPHLVAAGRGDVVLVSTDHVVPRPGSVPKAGFMEAYDAAKWALEGLRRNWAVTLGRAGVRVNTVAMGETDTPMLREFLADRGTAPERIDQMSVPVSVSIKWVVTRICVRSLCTLPSSR